MLHHDMQSAKRALGKMSWHHHPSPQEKSKRGQAKLLGWRTSHQVCACCSSWCVQTLLYPLEYVGFLTHPMSGHRGPREHFQFASQMAEGHIRLKTRGRNHPKNMMLAYAAFHFLSFFPLSGYCIVMLCEAIQRQLHTFWIAWEVHSYSYELSHPSHHYRGVRRKMGYPSPMGTNFEQKALQPSLD